MQTPLRWKSGIYASLFMLLLAAYPQARVWLERGIDHTGSYAFFNEDEAAYCAYVNALIDKRPRRSDPYTGLDDQLGQPQHESLFSIQFVPPYALSFAARALGLSAPCIFFVLTCMAAFFSSLALFWLLRLMTNDERLAAAASLFILCLGTFALVYGPVRLLFGMDISFSFSHLPFLRRYQPAAPFALLFVLCALVWRALTIENDRSALGSAVLAGIVFAVLVFSYFYLWTAAAAWLACVAVLWLLFRPENFRRGIKSLAVIGVLALAALVPYFYMVSQRAPTMDAMQLLVLSHAPDFSRSSERLGIILILLLAYALRRGRLAPRNHLSLFALAFALAPLLIFNQQIVTGRSLQPLHYEMYVTKYLSLISLVLIIALLWRGRESVDAKKESRVLAMVALIAFGWGIIETVVATNRHLQATLGRDEARFVAARFAEISREAPATHPDTRSLIFYTNIAYADSSPTLAPQPVLWSPHTPAFSGVTREENKERIYRLLYFTGFDETTVDARSFEKLDYRKQYLLRSLAGWGHAGAAWSVNWKPLTTEEIQAELQRYSDYRARFDQERAAQLPLSYVVTTTDEGIDFANLDCWYERDAGERLGKFIIYRVRLKQ
ncbi:MAG TPA: hypothetical protein VF658_03070 [Pyrinomonadaceae bacterium]|jgi:hypothetical protein